MRKIVSGLMVTVNGIYDHEDEWSAEYQSPEAGEATMKLMMSGDTLLLGRNTYEWFEEQFAGQSGGPADMMNNLPKYVVSGSMESAEWNNSTVISGDDLEAELKSLKEGDGANINVSGSGELVRSLLEKGLLDELNLFVYPLALESGKCLWDGLDSDLKLTVESVVPLPQGVTQIVYKPS